jgi:transposase
VKAKAVATAAEHGISKRTVERSFAKAEGNVPESKRSPPRDIEDEQRKRLLRVYRERLPVVQRWFRMQIGAER